MATGSGFQPITPLRITDTRDSFGATRLQAGIQQHALRWESLPDVGKYRTWGDGRAPRPHTAGAQEISCDLRTSASISWTESVQVEWIETGAGMQLALAGWLLIVGWFRV